MVQTAPAREDLPRLLVVAPDVVGAKMAGPGMRYVSISKALAPHMPVTLALGIEGSEAIDLDSHGVTVTRYTTRSELELLVAASDVVFCQFFDTNVARIAVNRGVRLVFDLYNALPVETVGSEVISGFTGEADKDREFRELISYFRFCSEAGSYFVASNERQRDYWLGFIMASGGLLPSTIGTRALGDVIGLAPFGMEDRDPVQRQHGLRGHHGIANDDIVAIWAGGIWDWFDAETPIRAIARLAQDDPRFKLVFYGTVHPNSAIGRPPSVERAMAVADELGVLGSSVIFLDEWVPAADRANYLLDADLAVSAHQDSLETRYAFRTRILDHFWAELPSVVSEGDWFAEYINREGLGIVAPVGDVDAMENAISTIALDHARKTTIIERVHEVRNDWRWSATTAQLRDHILGAIRTAPAPVLPQEATSGPTLFSPLSSGLVTRLRKTAMWRFAGRVRRRLAH